MATRRPLIADGGNLREATDSEISLIIARAKDLYRLSPSVKLQVVGSGGNLGTINDTRLQAGASKTSVSAYPAETSTAEPSTVTVGWSRVNEVLETVAWTANGDDNPLYYDANGNLRAMSNQDMYDTFIHPAINSAYSTTYKITTSTTPTTGYSLVSNTTIFQDTGADTSLYSKDEIGEDLDQPYVRVSWYLHQVAGIAAATVFPVKTNSSKQVQVYNGTSFDTVLLGMTRYAAVHNTGYKIRHGWNTPTGVSLGSVWDDRLNGTGNYQKRFVNGDDYRAQEFPDGSFVRINTYFLKGRLE